MLAKSFAFNAGYVCILLLGLTLIVTADTSEGSHKRFGGSNRNFHNKGKGKSHNERDNKIIDDISIISEYWANLRPYQDNPATIFDVDDTGLPLGCQIEQVHVLHRHASRYPTSNEYSLMTKFVQKVNAGKGRFTGKLSFLNTWNLRLGLDSLLQKGFKEGFSSGVDFWMKYGRILYNASVGQGRYNPTGQVPPLLRANTFQRIQDTAHAWAEGFFGLNSASGSYSLLSMPVTNRNNTLASYVSCSNLLNPSLGFINLDKAFTEPLPYFLNKAAARLSSYAPSDIRFNVNDTFAMQSICPYEYATFGSSDFCSLFTLEEWKGFEYATDLILYNGFGFGSPLGRAIGLGYLEELIARLKNEQISVSSSSVNSTLDSSPSTFPLNQLFYLDVAHDISIVSLLAAASIDYFRQTLPKTQFPPPDRKFRASRITPFAARFTTEKIGCVSSQPIANHFTPTQYTPTQYGYSPSSAPYKFIRIRINNGIVPLKTLRGGQCNLPGRTDGLCPLDNFLATQVNAAALANYPFGCFGSYNPNSIVFNGDGNFHL